jgi:acetyl-CoA carboxylase biotin carboxyl carrier protein
VDAKELRGILEAVAKTDVNELTLETGDYKLSVKRGGAVVMQAVAPVQTYVPPPLQSQVDSGPSLAKADATVVAETKAAPASNLLEISAPIVGTFYASASPDSPVFVKVGDKIEAGKVLCIIEAMKLMNEIEAEMSGTIAEILVKNEEPVEYGQVLFRVSPSK